MFMRDRAVRAGRRVVLLALAMSMALSASATPVEAADALLYRIFLQDGSTLVSYGDFARVADRVVFSIPIGGLDGPSPTLHLISIAESTVDWERTDQYAEATRARHYAATQGEVDFDTLSTEVARALHDVATTKDPARRLALATDARRMLGAWPGTHHGYRASDVAQLTALLDDAVGELRVAAGLPRVDLTLVATASPLPPSVPELPPPTLRESIEQAFRAAAVIDDPAERVALLQAIVTGVGAARRQAAEKASWTSILHARASAALVQERKTDRSYSDLVSRMVTAADERRRRADVNGIEKLVAAVLKADDRLGRRRPQTTAALLATLDGRLDAARRLRLARDAWAIRRDDLADYQRRIRSAVERMRRSVGRPRADPPAVGPGARRAAAARGAHHRWLARAEDAPASGRSRTGAQPVRQRAAARHSRRVVTPAGDYQRGHEQGVGSLGGRRRCAADVRACTRGLAQADGTPWTVITPRTTRLLRVPDLQAMHRALAECVTANAIAVPRHHRPHLGRG